MTTFTVSLRRRLHWPTFLTTLLFLLAGSQCYAQFLRAVDNTKPPLRRIYGVGDNEFYLSGYFQKWTQFSEQPWNDTRYDDLWNHAHYMRIPILHIAVPNDGNFHNFYNHTSKQAGDRVSLIFGDAFRSGWGQAIELYPFDSVQSTVWPTKFLHRQGGGELYNAVELDAYQRGKREVQYTTTNTGANDSILWGTVYGYNQSKQIYRYAPYSMPLYHFEDSVQNNESILRPNHTVGPDTLPYLVVTGHLRRDIDQNSAVSNDSALLRIDIIYELPKFSGAYGQRTRYFDNTLGRRVAQSDTEMLCRSFFVRKGQLQPAAGGQWNAYREAAFEMNLQWCSDMRTPGPNTLLSTDSLSRRFDIRVHWLGVDEDLYLRSISVRDSVGQLVLGQQQRCITWRNNTLMRGLKEIFYGPNQNFNNGISTYAANTFRSDIIALQSGEEQHSSEYGVYAAMQKMVADSFNLLPVKGAGNMQQGDSVQLFSFSLGNHAFEALGGSRQASTYMYMNDLRDTVKHDSAGFKSYWAKSPHISPQHIFETTMHQVPTLVEHNGGRGHLPTLNLTEQGIEDYNTAFQRMFLGFYDPTESDLYRYPYNAVPGIIDGIGNTAELARDQGTRHIPVIGTTFAINLRDSSTGGAAQYDTIYSHVPEGSELWTLANCALAYGAKGALWWYLGSYPGLLRNNSVGHLISSEDFACCVGSQGYYTYQNYQDKIDYQLHDQFPNPTQTITIPNFYIGWADRTDAIRGINQWLAQIGPYMMKLKWRDAYSIHHCVRDTSRSHDTLFRPLPANEIVKKVTSNKPGGPLDAPERTFVELGLFQTVASDTATSRHNDTNYIYVVNRRSFERPNGVSPGTDRGYAMDSLTDIRTISLYLNMKHPDSTSYNLVRVREVVSDNSKIPFIGGIRPLLDTVVGARSVVNLTLSAGRGTLIELSYTQPGDQMKFGDLRFNNQRKFMFDGVRWHALYQRRLQDSINLLLTDDYDAKILYRRSYAVRPGVGGILWEPDEYAISDSLVPGDSPMLNPDGVCMQNRFPSMTIRTDIGDTSIVFVWTAHHDPSKRERKVMFRTLYYNSTQIVRSAGDTIQFLEFFPKEVVSLYRGADGKAAETWGVPTISALHGSYAIAWSDDSLGVMAKLRTLHAGAHWWKPAPYLNSVNVSATATTMLGGIGLRPSVPSCANVRAKDSSCAIVWEHQTGGGANKIFYSRLEHIPFGSTPGLLQVRLDCQQEISEGTQNFHPSIDQTQDYHGQVQEAITWESVDYPISVIFNGTPHYVRDVGVNYLTMFTETRRRGGGMILPSSPQWDSIEVPTPQLRLKRWLVRRNMDSGWYAFPDVNPYFTYPNIGSANENAVAYQTGSEPQTYFSVVLNPYSAIKREWTPYGMRFLREPFKGTSQNIVFGTYGYGGGAWPNASASPIKQAGWQATLYERFMIDSMDTALRATREFMAKTRPTDYVSTGRTVHLLLDDTLRASISGSLIDVWMASDSSSNPVAMIQRSPTQQTTNTIGDVQALLRSENFTAHDSVVVGCDVSGLFQGDSLFSHGYELWFVTELRDASNNQVVAQLDSFAISAIDKAYARVVVDTLDLVSGSYYVQMRVAGDSLPMVAEAGHSVYPVIELFGMVEGGGGLAKLRREGTTTTAQARIDAQPNPFTGTTELRFSIPTPGYATVRVFDPVGRMIAEVLPQQWMEVGRYAVEFDASQLQPGTYLVELMLGQQRVVEKMVVVR